MPTALLQFVSTCVFVFTSAINSSLEHIAHNVTLLTYTNPNYMTSLIDRIPFLRQQYVVTPDRVSINAAPSAAGNKTRACFQAF